MRIVICGAGQVGFGIAERLAGEGHDVSVIDLSPQLIANVRDQLLCHLKNIDRPHVDFWLQGCTLGSPFL